MDAADRRRVPSAVSPARELDVKAPRTPDDRFADLPGYPFAPQFTVGNPL